MSTPSNSNKPTLAVVLAAAGQSRRLGFDKLFTPVLGQTIFQHGLARILETPSVGQIIIVTSAENEPVIARLLPPDAKKPIRVVLGGAERQDSVMAGLAAIDAAYQYVMIQDAARPFVTADLIEKVYAAARKTGAAVCGHPSIDTLKEVDSEGRVVRTIDRSVVWAVQTPQIFSRALLTEAYAAVRAKGGTVTDDTAAVEALGKPIEVVRHDEMNLKITRPTDWNLGVRHLFPVQEDVDASAQLRKLIHDFSNQVTSLLGFAYLIDSDCPSDSPLKNSINCLNQSVDKAHEITLAMQRFARDFHTRKTELQHGLENPSLARKT